MNLYRRNRGAIRFSTAESGGRKGVIIATAVILFVALVDTFSGGVVRDAARLVLAPAAHMMRTTSVALASGEFWSSRASLLKENGELRAERDRLRAREAGVLSLSLENAELAKMAHLAETESGGRSGDIGIAAPVVSSFRASPYGTFLIGAGLSHGVKEESIALTDGGFILGVVADVSDTTSLVRMVFAPGETTDVVVGPVGFSLTGRGGGNASSEVPREAELREGDPVIAPRFANRPVGIIGKIESATSSAYADIYVVFPLNLNSIRYVYIVPGI